MSPRDVLRQIRDGRMISRSRGRERNVERVRESGIRGVENGYFDRNCGSHDGWLLMQFVNARL